MAESSRVPTFAVKVNGADLPPEASTDLFECAVLEDLDAPSMFVLRLVNWDMETLALTWSDGDLFAEGSEVEIQMGYVDALETLLVGEVTGLEPEFEAGRIPTLTVRGYDRRHLLLRGRKTRSFLQMKDSEIAGQIAGDAGLTADAIDTGVVLDYVLQSNQSDFEFLTERARRIGYEVSVVDKTLRFGPYRHGEQEALVLARDVDLREFRPRLTTVAQLGKVAVQGWDPKQKAALAGAAAAGSETTTMGGSASGPQTSIDAFGETMAARTDLPVATQAEADQIAAGLYNGMALAFVSGDGTCIGRTDLRAGVVAMIEGAGKRFSGLYYVTSVNHSYTSERGYQTGFSLRRNAA